MTTRRSFLSAVGAALAARSLPAAAQSKPSVPHIAYLSAGTAESNGALVEALRQSLRELGYVDGKNIVIDVSWAGAYANTFPELAASIVKSNPSAVIGTCIPSTRAAKKATSTIPVVMSVDGDPVAARLVASLARPGGNVTGAATLFEALIPKWLELISTAVPKARDIALLSDPDNVVDEYLRAKSQDAANRIGVNVLQFGARNAGELDTAFADIRRSHAGALVVLTEAFMTSQLPRIVPLVKQQRLPAIFGYREFTEAGGLMSYGVSFREYYKRVARYIDLVLKGTKPADLPVEQPAKIELAINVATARKLGVTIQRSLLLRADHVIE